MVKRTSKTRVFFSRHRDFNPYTIFSTAIQLLSHQLKSEIVCYTTTVCRASRPQSDVH